MKFWRNGTTARERVSELERQGFSVYGCFPGKNDNPARHTVSGQIGYLTSGKSSAGPVELSIVPSDKTGNKYYILRRNNVGSK